MEPASAPRARLGESTVPSCLEPSSRPQTPSPGPEAFCRIYTGCKFEQPFKWYDGITHGVGAVLAIVGLAALVGFAAVHGGASHVVGCAVFGATLVILYSASTLYHGLRSPRLKPALRLVDHSAIFLLIAGTYTPVALVILPDAWGWSILAVVWGLALLGIVLRWLFRRAPAGGFVPLYLLMGWVIVVAFEPLVEGMATGGVVLLVAGGLAYTSSIVFFAWKRLPYNHAIWHVFVLAGSALHYFAVLFYVVPLASGR